jgi:hypothetical protein
MIRECDRCGEEKELDGRYFPASPEFPVFRLCRECDSTILDVIEEFRTAGESMESATSFGGVDE